MKNLFAIAMLFTFLSCGPFNDSESELKEIEVKTAKLEYLKELYSVRQDIEFKEARKSMDSMIQIMETELNERHGK